MRHPNQPNRDGFDLADKPFSLPKNSTELDAKTKRAVTICNLFLNQQLTISDIIRVLDEDYGTVVLALLERGLIRERRQRSQKPPQGTERRKRNPIVHP